MDVLISLAGAVVVGLALLDVFHTLWHPTGRGRVSRLVMSSVWRATQRWRRPRWMRASSGPAAMVATVVVWGLLVVLGFLLVYLPFMPGAFSFGPGLYSQERSAVLDALYLSLVAVATLGFGDIVPQAGWLRVVTPVQALVGFVLLTAAVSWVLQIYSALGRRRALAVHLTTLERAGAAEQLRDLEGGVAAHLLLEVAQRLAHVRVDLSQYSETYYFRDSDRDASLPRAVAYAVRLAGEGRGAQSREARLAGSVLRHAIGVFAETLSREGVLESAAADTRAVLLAYRSDHE